MTTAELAKLHRSLRDRPYAANRLIAVVSAMFNWAGTRHIVPPGFNPAGHVERYKERGRERFLSGEELDRLGAGLWKAETTGTAYCVKESKPNAKHAARPENRFIKINPYSAAAIRLLILTGARLREILHLRWSDVDFVNGRLNLGDSKTGKKSIILNAPALSILDALPCHGEIRYRRSRSE